MVPMDRAKSFDQRNLVLGLSSENQIIIELKHVAVDLVVQLQLPAVSRPPGKCTNGYV
jgi:hypothetical protein